MTKLLSKSLFWFGSAWACLLMAFSSGCASGGYKLTRQYARWLNSNHIIIRIVLYLLTAVVFAVTLLIDAVVFNTMDFWKGTVSSGTYEFEQHDKKYFVQHEVLPGSNLKRSTIKIFSDKTQLQELVLNETTAGDIELFVDGKLKSRVSHISAIPVATVFDNEGQKIEEKFIWAIAGL